MAQYFTGTVDVTNGSPTVVGNDTFWLNNIFAGNDITIASTGITYQIANVISNTELVLTSPYQGTTSSEENYTIQRDYTSPDNFPLIAQGDIETATILSRAINRIQQRFNLAADAAAILAAGIYPNTAAGLSATTDGDYFFVVDNEEFILYLNDNNVAIEQLKFASLTLVQQALTALTNAVTQAEAFANDAEDFANNADLSATEAADSAAQALDAASQAEASALTAEIQAIASSDSATNSATNAAIALDERLLAEDAAAISLSIANFRGRWVDLFGSMSVPSSVYHNGEYWQLLEDIDDVTEEEPDAESEVWANIAFQLVTNIGTAVHFTSSDTFPLPINREEGSIFRFTKISNITPIIQSAGGQEIITSNGQTTELEYDIMMELIVVFDGQDWHLLDQGG